MKVCIVFIVFVWIAESRHFKEDGKLLNTGHADEIDKKPVRNNYIEKGHMSRKGTHRKSHRDKNIANKRKTPAIKHSILYSIPQALRNHINGKSMNKWVNAGGSGRAKLIPIDKSYKPIVSPITAQAVTKRSKGMFITKEEKAAIKSLIYGSQIFKNDGKMEYKREPMRGDIENDVEVSVFCYMLFEIPKVMIKCLG